jgi:hypothetical protein
MSTLERQPCDDAAMEKQNRAQRRKGKFGGGRTDEQRAWPASRPNPVFGAQPTADAAAGAPDQDRTDATGAGTGGATEQADRAPRDPGTDASDGAKS